MKSFIGWIGGKSHLKNRIIPLIPDDCKRYIEVCGGAGWVLFGKEQRKDQMEVFNDVDGDLINLYRVIKKINVKICKMKLTGCIHANYLSFFDMKLKIKFHFQMFNELQDIYIL